MSTERSQLGEKEEFADDFITLLSDMLYKLTEHHLIAKSQNQYLKSLNASLKPNECKIILDLAENFSFVIQNAAQAFHWNNTQAAIHLFVVYDKSNNGDLCHRAFGILYVKLYLPQLQKIHYFSGRSCAQYKNSKNFANLIFHVQDIGITAEWNFFATSHGKNLCDGVGGTVKCCATRASLQRPLDNQILTPYQLFEFASQDISGITSFYVDSETVKKTEAILEPRI